MILFGYFPVEAGPIEGGLMYPYPRGKWLRHENWDSINKIVLKQYQP